MFFCLLSDNGLTSSLNKSVSFIWLVQLSKTQYFLKTGVQCSFLQLFLKTRVISIKRDDCWDHSELQINIFGTDSTNNSADVLVDEGTNQSVQTVWLEG